MLKATILRTAIFTVLFAILMPLAFSIAGFGSSFAFTGSILSALAVGVIYMACMFGVVVLWGLAMAPFKLTDEQKMAQWPWTSASFVLATAFCLLGAHLLPFLGLTVVGWIPALLGGAISIPLFHYTMPAGSKTAKAS